MQRIIQGRAATLTQTFYSDGNVSDPSPDVAHVTVTRDDGTVLVDNQTAIEAGPGQVSWTLTPTQTALLDTLTVEWTATFSGGEQTFIETVEIAGGALFRIAEALSRPSLASVPVDQIAQARTAVEQALERKVGFAFVPRYASRSFSGDGTCNLLFPPYTRAIRWVKVGGVDTTTTLTYDGGRYLTNPARWTKGLENITAGYEHGLDQPDVFVSIAALDWAESLLSQDSSIDSRAERLITDDGTLVFSAGTGTGISSVDRIVAMYARPVVA